MTTPSRFNSWIEYVNEGAVNWDADVFKLALTNSAPVATNSTLSNITEISYTNLSSRTLTISSAGQTSGTYTAVCDQLTLTATGTVGPFRYIVVYDDTATGDPLVGWYDYGSAVTLNSGDSFVFGATATFTLWEDAPA